MGCGTGQNIVHQLHGRRYVVIFFGTTCIEKIERKKSCRLVCNSIFSDAVDDLGLAPLFNLLNTLNLPPIPAAFTKKAGDYIEQLASVKKVLGRDVFFGFDVIPDPRNTDNNIMLFDTPVTSSPLPKYEQFHSPICCAFLVHQLVKEHYFIIVSFL